MTKRFTAKTTILLCCLVVLFVCTFLCAQFIAPAQADSNYTSTYITNPTFTVLDGKTPSGDDAARTQSYNNLFDGNTNTKYCVKLSDGPYVVIKSSHTDTKIIGYTFYTGNDTDQYSSRNPKDWTLYGCNDYNESTKTGTWTAVHTMTNDTTMGATNKTGYTFNFEPEFVFRYFKFEFTARRGLQEGENMGDWFDDNIQLSEIKIITEPNPSTYDTQSAFYTIDKAYITDGDVTTYPSLNSGNDIVITSKKTNVVVSGYRFYTLSGPYSLQNQTPKTWVLYGSSNKSDWTEIHREENKTIWNASPTWFEFSIPNNTTAYKYYKFSFLESNYQGTDTPDNGNIKISEIEMVQASSVSIPDTNPPTSETYSAFTALDGTAPYKDKADHSYKNIFIGDYGKDNNRLFYTAGDINDPRYVIFKSNSFGTIIKKYTIISPLSNDPNVSWTFYGCNDHDESIKGDRNNGSWVELDSQSGIKFNILFYLQNEGNTFTVANPVPYKYYKFEFKPSSENSNSFGYLRISRVVFDKDEAPVVDNSQQTIKSDSSKVSVNIGNGDWFDNDLSTVALVNYSSTLNLDVMLKGNGAIVYGATYHFATAPQNPSAVSAMFDNATLKLTPYLGTSKTFNHLSTIVSEDFKDYTVLFNVGNNYVKGGTVQYAIEFDSTVTEQLSLAEIDLLHNYACEHSFTGSFKPAVEGDCLTPGYKSYRVCDFNCGACQYYGIGNALEVCEAHQYATEVAIAEAHNWGTEQGATAGDCGHDGNLSYKQCSDCNSYQYTKQGIQFICAESEFDTKIKIPATGEHKQLANSHKNAADPECIYSGHYEYYKCSTCGYYVYQKDGKTLLGRYEDTQIDPTGNHVWSTEQIIAQVPATCTSTGTKAHWHCNQCNKDYGTDKSTVLTSLTITALGHTYGEWTSYSAPTCTATGNYAYRQCSACDEYQYIEDLTITNYDAYVAGSSHPALKTCASAEFDSKIKLAKVDHVFGDWVSFKYFTCTEDGNWWHHKCTQCDLYEYFIYPVASCDPDEYLAEKPGDRKTTTDYSDITENLFAHHVWGSTTQAKNASCTEDGNYEWQKCNICKGYQYKIGENTDFCAENEFDTKVKLPKHHTWGAVVKGTEATCVAVGKAAYRLCTVSGCGACQCASSKYDVDANYFDTATSSVYVTNSVAEVPTYNQLSHDFVLVEDSKAPTCTEYGNYNYSKCDRGCNQYKYYVGSTAQYCDATEENYNTNIRRNKLEHSYGTLIAEEPAICTAKGLAAHYECSECHYLFDANKVKTPLAELELPINPNNHVFATSCQKKCSYCAYERTENERVHKYDQDGNACLYNGVTDKHAYFCTNDHCTEGVLYEDHTMVLVCAQDGTWQHWYKCSKSGCPYETSKSKVACVIKYENKDADKHVSYCEVGNTRHELGENGAVKEEKHEWTTDYVFNQAKCDAGEGNFHAKQCEKCGVFAQNQEACDVVYYTEDDTDHWQICDTCKHKLTDDEPHTYVMVYDEIEHWEECSVCGKIKDGYFYHTFALATSTSCSEEGCGYQRFLKANFTINGYAIDALVGGITASATTDRTDANLSLVQYELYNSDIGKIDFAESKTDAKMTFRPNTVYYALMFFDCGDVYPSNDMTAADFTLPKGFEYGYFDIGNYPREDGTYYVRMTLTVVLSPLGGVSAEKSVSEMEIDLKNFQAGKKFGDVVIDITCKGLPTDKSFTIGNKSYSDVAGSTITDETAIAATAYSIITIVTAPEGFNFYGLTDSDVTVKNDMGTVYLMPMEEGKISRDGKTIMIIIVINGLVPEHVCGADGWEVVDSYYDFFGVDKSTQHTQMCKTCGAIEFVNHVFDNDFDIICDDCEYERMLKLDEMHFTLTGYQADAQLKGINVTYSGKYASTETVTCIGKPEGMIVDLETQSSYSETATFVPGKAYGIMIEIKIPSAIDTSSCTLDNVYVNNTKVKVIMGMGNGSTYYYVLQLPAVTGESKQTKVSDVNLEVSGFIHGTNLGTVALDKLDTHPAIASYTASVTQNGNSMSTSQAFAYGNQYVLTVVYTLKDGYYGMGVTADDLKVSHYAVDSNSQKIDLGNFECISITVDDFGDDNTNNRTITCKYLVELVVPQDVEDHTEGHVFPTENVKYHTDENKHYVLCGCGAHDEGEEHVYDDDDVFVCSVCGYVRVYSVENMQFEFDWRVGNHIWYIIRKMNMSVNGSEVVFDENGYTNLMLFIEGAMLYEGTITDISAFQYLDESEVVLANKSYTLVMLFAYANEYLDCGALAEKDYTITGIGETPITASYVLNFNMGSRTTAAAVIFNIPAIEAKHVHGGTWIDEVPATCTEIGTKGHYVCTICGDSFDADDVKIDDLTILAPGHNFSTTEIIAQVPATCTTTGTKAHWHCGTCNKDFDTDKSTVIDDLTIQALGHTYGTWIAEEPATCTNTGMLAHYECSVCHTLFDENKAEKTAADLTIAINSTAHKFGTWIDEVPATLEKDGTVAHKDCEYCHKHFDANNEEISGDDLTIAKIAGYNLIFKIDGEEVAKHYLAQGSAVTYPTSGSKQGFTFAWSQTIQTMPASDVTIEGIFAIDVNYFKSKVDAVQNATTVEDIYSAIVSANTALALYDGMDTQSIGDQITRLDTLTTQYKQMAQTATSDVTNAVNVVSAVFGALVQMAIVALATVIVKRRLF